MTATGRVHDLTASEDPQASRPARAHSTRYLALCAAVVVLVAGQQLHAQWSGDAWLHAAAVREFAEHLFDPRDPVLGVQAAHPMLSPYSFVAGVMALATGNAIDGLMVMAFVNLGLVLWGLWRFVLVWAPLGTESPTTGRRAAFWALLFVLALWGPGAWRWSGFMHLGALGFVLPFPSASAMGVTLLTLAAAKKGLSTGRGWWLLGTSLAVAYVLLTHPPTAIALALGFTALAISTFGKVDHRLLLLTLGATGAGAALALVWPLFPIVSLRPTPSFAEMHDVLLQDTLWRVAPLLVGLVPLTLRLIRDRRDPLSLLAVFTIVACAIGPLTGATALLRLLPTAALALQVCCGWGAVRLEDRLRDRVSTRARRVVEIGAFAVIAVWGLLLGRAAIVRSVPSGLLPESVATDERLTSVGDQYEPIGAALTPEDVVIAPLEESRYLAAFGGYQAGSFWENPYVRDDTERRDEIKRFYNTTDADREAIVARRGVTHVLTRHTDRSTQGWLERRGAVPIVRTDQAILYSLQTHPQGGKRPS